MPHGVAWCWKTFLCHLNSYNCFLSGPPAHHLAPYHDTFRAPGKWDFWNTRLIFHIPAYSPAVSLHYIWDKIQIPGLGTQVPPDLVLEALQRCQACHTWVLLTCLLLLQPILIRFYTSFAFLRTCCLDDFAHPCLNYSSFWKAYLEGHVLKIFSTNFSPINLI